MLSKAILPCYFVGLAQAYTESTTVSMKNMLSLYQCITAVGQASKQAQPYLYFAIKVFNYEKSLSLHKKGYDDYIVGLRTGFAKALCYAPVLRLRLRVLACNLVSIYIIMQALLVNVVSSFAPKAVYLRSAICLSLLPLRIQKSADPIQIRSYTEFGKPVVRKLRVCQ